MLGILFIPVASQAATASAAAVLEAIAGATKAGLCTERSQTLSDDCVKSVVRCDGGSGGRGWEEYVNNKYQVVGGVLQPKALPGRHAEPATYSTDELDYLRADVQRNSVVAPGPVQKSTCYCACGANDSLEACQGKPEGFPYRAGDALTHEECAAACLPHAPHDKCGVPPVAPNAPASSAGFALDALCFTPSECATQEGIFEEHAACRGKGRCYAAEPPIDLQVPIGDVTQVQGLSRYVVAAYRYGVSIAAVAATIMFVYGAFLYLLGSALPSLSKGKQYMLDAILGMVFVFAAALILRTINPATTQLDPLKVYMVNTQQFLAVAQCRDLPGTTRVALAGIPPTVVPYETVAAREGAFDTLPSGTECGYSYWIDHGQGGTAARCEGSRCPNGGEACVSCSNPDTPGCGGVASARRVCVKTIFAGTIDFVDGKYPTGVELMGVCNIQADDQDAPYVEEGMKSLAQVKPERVGQQFASSQSTEADEVGRASFTFAIEDDAVQEVEEYCADFNGVRGYVLAVVYKESFSSTGATLDDIAVLGPTQCGAAQFGGYANGTREDVFGDEGDIASALVCGRRQGVFVDGADYWDAARMRSAVAGSQAITCDFSLSDDSAPSNPADTFCKAGSQAVDTSCRWGAECSTVGATCEDDRFTCTCLNEGFGARNSYRNCVEK